jgi:uncharacterized membrane protein
MIPNPLHPAVVHIPVALAVILPLIIALSVYLIRKGTGAVSAWLPVAVLSVLLFGGALLAKQSGGAEEEAVEGYVSEQVIEAHEENAELFTVIAGVLVVLVAGGFLKKNLGKSLRIAAAAASIVLFALAFRTGHSGGELVYRYGAASVNRMDAVPASADGRSAYSRGDRHSDD